MGITRQANGSTRECTSSPTYTMLARSSTDVPSKITRTALPFQYGKLCERNCFQIVLTSIRSLATNRARRRRVPGHLGWTDALEIETFSHPWQDRTSREHDAQHAQRQRFRALASEPTSQQVALVALAIAPTM